MKRVFRYGITALLIVLFALGTLCGCGPEERPEEQPEEQPVGPTEQPDTGEVTKFEWLAAWSNLQVEYYGTDFTQDEILRVPCIFAGGKAVFEQSYYPNESPSPADGAYTATSTYEFTDEMYIMERRNADSELVAEIETVFEEDRVKTYWYQPEYEYYERTLTNDVSKEEWKYEDDSVCRSFSTNLSSVGWGMNDFRKAQFNEEEKSYTINEGGGDLITVKFENKRIVYICHTQMGYTAPYYQESVTIEYGEKVPAASEWLPALPDYGKDDHTVSEKLTEAEWAEAMSESALHDVKIACRASEYSYYSDFACVQITMEYTFAGAGGYLEGVASDMATRKQMTYMAKYSDPAGDGSVCYESDEKGEWSTSWRDFQWARTEVLELRPIGYIFSIAYEDAEYDEAKKCYVANYKYENYLDDVMTEREICSFNLKFKDGKLVYMTMSYSLDDGERMEEIVMYMELTYGVQTVTRPEGIPQE